MIDQAADISHIFAMAELVNGNFESRPSQLFLPYATPHFSFPVFFTQAKQCSTFINSAACYSTQ